MSRRVATHTSSRPTDVIEHPLERPDAAWTADDAQMQAQGHHPGANRGSFLKQPVEAVHGVARPVGGAERRRGPQLHVVGVQRVGHHQDGARLTVGAFDVVPERQVAGIVVHMIDKALLGQQAAGAVGMQQPGEPAHRRDPNAGLDAGPGAANEIPLLALRHAVLEHPAVTVASGLVALVPQACREGRGALQGQGRGRRGDGDPVRLKQPEHPWGAEINAVAVVGLVGVHPHRPFGNGAEFVHRLGP